MAKGGRRGSTGGGWGLLRAASVSFQSVEEDTGAAPKSLLHVNEENSPVTRALKRSARRGSVSLLQSIGRSKHTECEHCAHRAQLQLWRDQMVALLAGDQHGANGAVARAAMSLTQVPCTCDPAAKRERGVRPRPARS
jgi:hypothetical protein